jgi:hypothetical protein
MPALPHPRCLQHAIDFKGIGAKWMDELRLRQRIGTPGHVLVHVAHATGRASLDGQLNSKQLLDRITSRVNSAHGRLNAEKLNDFFNGVDLVAEDLSHRL